MKKLITLLVVFGLMAGSLAAQQVCTQTAPISATAGSTATVIAAKEALGTIIICGFIVTGNTTATGVKFNNVVMSDGTTATPVMLTPANGPLVYGNGVGQIMQSTAGAAVTVTCTTGACTGIMSFR